MKNNATRNTEAATAYARNQKNVLANISTLQELLATLKSTASAPAPASVNWGDVGSMAKTAADIQELITALS